MFRYVFSVIVGRSQLPPGAALALVHQGRLVHCSRSIHVITAPDA
jgi:hypothetical protein